MPGSLRSAATAAQPGQSHFAGVCASAVVSGVSSAGGSLTAAAVVVASRLASMSCSSSARRIACRKISISDSTTERSSG
ncbi:hypothetical protein [Streptomyces sp. 049-1]|uniref:hypothetical protein n=1 Tax=Streptomyces sp. 049-1 TaxID=2789264 RepID=UPI00397EB871